MKLLVQSDDYGITPAVSAGIIYAIEHGIVRNTGMFTNMPWAEECAEMIRPYLDRIALGVDLNASTGPSLLGYEKVPALCHENGMFLTSSENRAADVDAPDHDHVNYEQLYAEFDAQIQRYIELFGRLPDYIHGHAYGSPTTERVRRELAEKYDRPYVGTIRGRMGVSMYGESWYVSGGPEAQLKEDPLGHILSGKCCDVNSDFGYIICHCGFADAKLFRLSSYNICRPMDTEAMCSKEIREWVEKNRIELITFRELERKYWD